MLLAAYDEQLRTDAPSAVGLARLGPLRLVTFGRGRGWVTYRDLGGADALTIRGWVAEVLEHYLADPAITRVEWKTRGHDRAPGLHEALLEHGFEAGEPESVMIGEATRLAVEAPVPDGVVLRQIRDPVDVQRMSEMQLEVFGNLDPGEMTAALLRRQSLRDGMELWVAESGSRIVCAGRLEPVTGTDFAGIWGGATVEDWRGRGLYRALTATRARSALRVGKSLVHSDSTAHSRPVLERYGFVAVTTTTPYTWRRRPTGLAAPIDAS